MDGKSLEVTLKLYLKEMRERLEQATSIAKATETCAEAGNVEKGIEIALDIEQLIYEVNTFLNAASLIRPDRFPRSTPLPAAPARHTGSPWP